MSFVQRPAAHCDQCGHEWLVVAAKTPTHCAKCRSRKWNMAGGDSKRVDLGSQPKPAPIFGTEPQGLLGRDVAIPSAIIKTGNDSRERPATDMQALRDICAGKLTKEIVDSPSFGEPVEIPICGKQWWEDGEHYECLMDKGHKEQKHGMRGMVRKVD